MFETLFYIELHWQAKLNKLKNASMSSFYSIIEVSPKIGSFHISGLIVYQNSIWNYKDGNISKGIWSRPRPSQSKWHVFKKKKQAAKDSFMQQVTCR